MQRTGLSKPCVCPRRLCVLSLVIGETPFACWECSDWLGVKCCCDLVVVACALQVLLSRV